MGSRMTRWLQELNWNFEGYFWTVTRERRNRPSDPLYQSFSFHFPERAGALSGGAEKVTGTTTYPKQWCLLCAPSCERWGAEKARRVRRALPSLNNQVRHIQVRGVYPCRQTAAFSFPPPPSAPRGERGRGSRSHKASLKSKSLLMKSSFKVANRGLLACAARGARGGFSLRW